MIIAIFDIRAGNPIPLLYSVCIKTIEVIKHPDFIKWHAEVREKVPQLPYIFLNMLHKVLSQLASFSTNSVNNSLIEHGDNGSKLKVDLVVKIVKFVTRFFANIENNIMEGTVPDSVPNFTPRDANPKIRNAVAPVAEIAALKVKPDASPPGTPARERVGKNQKVKPATKDFTKAGLFRCKEGHQLQSCSQATSARSCVLSFRFTTRNAQSQIKPVILSTSESGTRSLSLTKQRSSNTAMRLVAIKFGWMLRLS